LTPGYLSIDFFKIRCIVSMPRNIFIDTPTLTSLLFAQKKSAEEIEAWDKMWDEVTSVIEARVKSASGALRRDFVTSHSGTEIAERFVQELAPIVTERDWIVKSGKSPSILKMKRDWSGQSPETVASYFRDISRTAGFKQLCLSYAFAQVVKTLDHTFPVFVVEEVGYKLSKRKEKARANQLCLFKGLRTGSLITNLHLAEEEAEVLIQTADPQTVLDSMRRSVVWEAKP
jgi:type I restriction enzyme M protein